MRICLATNGTRGDVYPFLAIGRILAARGHEVVVFTHPYFRQDCLEAGLGHDPLGTEIDLDNILRHPDLFHHRRGQRLILRWVRESLTTGIADFRRMVAEIRPDAVVSHYFLLGARQLCEEAGLPRVTVCLAPCAWLSMTDPSPAMQQTPGRWRRRAASAAMHAAKPVLSLVSDRMFARDIREAGLDPGRGIMIDAFRGGTLNLGMWSHRFRGPCPDDPPGGVITGFAHYEGSPRPSLSDELTRFLDGGERPLVFAMGSAAHHTAGRFYEMAAGVCQRLGRRGVLLTGDPARAPADLPSTVLAVGAAPFGLLFPRALVTIQHGGIGSVGQAMRAGRPTLVVPRAHDQFNNGVHVHRLGVGLTRHFHRLTERSMCEAVDRLCRDASIGARAAELGAQLQQEHGDQTAADYIEQHCEQHTG